MRVDWAWVDEQLAAVGYTGTGRTRVIDVLTVLESGEYRSSEREEVIKILDMAKNLFLGTAIAEPEPDILEGTWAQAERGYIVKKDVVRVKPEAYVGEAGVRHNGKVGRVTAVKGDHVYVIYEGETIDDTVSHNLINLLKKL